MESFINRRTLRRAILFFGLWMMLFLILASFDILAGGWSDFIYFAPTKVSTGMIITLLIVILLYERVEVKLLARFESESRTDNGVMYLFLPFTGVAAMEITVVEAIAYWIAGVLLTWVIMVVALRLSTRIPEEGNS